MKNSPHQETEINSTLVKGRENPSLGKVACWRSRMTEGVIFIFVWI
jgi:hypothetical protein